MALRLVMLAALLVAAPAPGLQPAAAPATAEGPRAILIGSLEQGGIVRGRLPPGSRDAALDGRPVKLAADGRFVIGFGRDAAATAMLAWTTATGAAASQSIPVSPRQWPTEALPTLPPRPVPDAEFEARRPAEVAEIAAARATVPDRDDWQGEFFPPVEGRQSGVFGAQRILSGIPEAPHSGVDFAVPAGTEVHAPCGGIVRLATGPFTLEGNLVMIDHGFGMVSAFLHLSRIDVKPGDIIEEGKVIGAVGATGRATGPHLHWSLTWRDVRVDPAGVLVNGRAFE